MPNEFAYDLFLSHSAKDKPVVRAIAERLRADGVKVWFDEWVLKPGDSIPSKIEEGPERSRVLVLCMSANAFGSDWAQLESGTFRFRDPLNKDRRFLPLRLDDAPILLAYARMDAAQMLDEDLDEQTANRVAQAHGLTESTGESSIGKHQLRSIGRIGLTGRQLSYIPGRIGCIRSKRILNPDLVRHRRNFSTWPRSEVSLVFPRSSSKICQFP